MLYKKFSFTYISVENSLTFCVVLSAYISLLTKHLITLLCDVENIVLEFQKQEPLNLTLGHFNRIYLLNYNNNPENVLKTLKLIFTAKITTEIYQDFWFQI